METTWSIVSASVPAVHVVVVVAADVAAVVAAVVAAAFVVVAVVVKLQACSAIWRHSQCALLYSYFGWIYRSIDGSLSIPVLI